MWQFARCLELAGDVFERCQSLARGTESIEEGNALSTPSASSPRPWTKMKAADLEGSEGGEDGCMMIGGLRSVDILYSEV